MASSDPDMRLLREMESAKEYVENQQSTFDPDRICQAVNEGERGDAQLFRELHRGKYCYDHATGQWFRWAGNFWEEDTTGYALAAVDAVAEAFDIAAGQQDWNARKPQTVKSLDSVKDAVEMQKKLMAHKARLQELKRRENVLILAASGPDSLGITGAEWDSDPWLLGCANGVINLRDGSFRDGKPEDFIKTVAPTAWQGLDAPAPHFEKFIREVFQDHAELISYVHRLFGYSICGEAKEHVFPILFGQGRNGKGTLLEVLRSVLGPLAGPIRSETLLDSKYSQGGASHTADLMLLRGKRLVWASETDEGRYFSVGKVKWLVGGDTLVGRPPHGKRFIEFKPSHTLFLLTNSKPHASAEDFAFWQRASLIPFVLSFVDNPEKANERKRDPDLPGKLREEAPGILAWLVRGCLEWQGSGLAKPDIVKAATTQYQREEDVVGRFIDECCEVEEGASVQAGKLFDAYMNWCKSNNHKPLSSTNFGKRIGDRFEKKKSNGMLYLGIGFSTGDNPFLQDTTVELDTPF